MGRGACLSNLFRVGFPIVDFGRQTANVQRRGGVCIQRGKKKANEHIVLSVVYSRETTIE
jgi:hypothetical protein